MLTALIVGMIAFILLKVFRKQSFGSAAKNATAVTMLAFLLQVVGYATYFAINGLPS